MNKTYYSVDHVSFCKVIKRTFMGGYFAKGVTSTTTAAQIRSGYEAWQLLVRAQC